MPVKDIFLILLCGLFISSCAYITTKRDVHLKSYTLNIEEQTSIGAPMITSEHAQYAGGSRRYGLAEEQDQWESIEYPKEHSSKEVLIYNGRLDDVISISYKNFGKNPSYPDFSQELNFDLGVSDVIRFNNFKIKILNATNEYIRFIVFED